MKMVAAHVTLAGGISSIMVFASQKATSTSIVKAIQIANTFSRNATRRRDSFVESARRTIKRVNREAEKAAVVTILTKYGRMKSTNALMVASGSVTEDICEMG